MDVAIVQEQMGIRWETDAMGFQTRMRAMTGSTDRGGT